MNISLKGKVALITGGNQGLGLEITRAFVAAGASVTLCARNAELLAQAAASLRLHLAPGQRVETVAGDVSRLESANAMTAESLRQHGRLDILVNNAGVYGPMGNIEDVDWGKWVQAIEINLLGSILMCRAVLPGMKAQGGGKIVQLSGGGATNPMPGVSAYAVSKAGIVRFVETLALEVKESGIDVNAIAPGALNTRLLDEVLAAGPQKVGEKFYAQSLKQRASGGTPLSKGADLAVFLASDASNGVTGKLLSAVWDPWSELPKHLDELNTTDIYALRRIVPKDRGMGWGNDK
ncbi:MAG: SDR family oxidoreductase [Proteobacteria bacterium]|nr:SDR family oxidoreductase [Pseudomonadota bacterium]